MASTTTVLFLILLILKSIIIPSFSCPVHQKHALLNFKSNLTAVYDSKYPVKFVELDSWNPASDCCSWERVNCSETGSVTELQLSGVANPPDSDFNQVSISSEILTSLFRIRSLELLDISGNNLEGEIPGDGFGNLTKPIHLDMEGNYFNGSIPSQLFQLTNLRYLDMSGNYLDGVLSPEVGKLRNLESLYLRDNSISGNIPEEIGNLTNLRNLYLWENHFCNGIPSSIANLTKLEYLNLSNNSLSLEIPTFIGRLTNLTSLDLSSNQFTGPIPSSMQNLSKLIGLRLDDNMLTGEIPNWLFKIKTLKELYIGGKGSSLTWNNTTKIDPRCSLGEISMASCGISGQIPEWISSQKEFY